MIEVVDLDFRYALGPAVFDGFAWQVQPRDSWVIIGPSGCGKSTLLYLLAGLKQPSAGKIAISGQPVLRPRPQTGLVLQEYGLLPWATVRQNVALGLRIRRFYGPDGKHAPRDYAPGDIMQIVQHWLERLRIAEQADKYPAQLSGGQRQRAAIARTLVLQPDLLLMDEPFSSLDSATREDLQQVVVELQAETGITTVVVTHNIEEAVFLGRQILVLNNPPNQQPHIVENTDAAQPALRNTITYLERGNEIRRMMGLLH